MQCRWLPPIAHNRTLLAEGHKFPKIPDPSMSTKTFPAALLAAALCAVPQTVLSQGALMQLVAYGAQNLYLKPNSSSVTFDPTAAPCSLGAATPLTNQLAGLGVTFSGNGAIVNQCAGLVPAGAQSGTNYLAVQPVAAGSLEQITFDAPQANALFSLAGVKNVWIDAFLGGTMVVTGSFTFANPGDWTQPILVQAEAFDRLTIRRGESLAPWAIDDLFATPVSVVPEPSTNALLAMGLLCLTLAVKRHRASTNA